MLTTKKILRILLVIVFVLAPVYSASDAWADESRVKRSATIRPHIYRMMEKAQKLADKEDYAAAFSQLSKLERLRGSDYEIAMTLSIHAYIYFNQENYSKAIESYGKIAAIDGLPDSLMQNTLFGLAKLHLIQEDYTSALAVMEKWFVVSDKPSADGYVLTSQIHYSLKNYAEAQKSIGLAIKVQQEKGSKPRENWLVLERGINYQMKDYQALEKTLKNLVTHYPKTDYWAQLSAVYIELEKDDRALAALEIAFDQGQMTKERDILSFVYQLMGSDIPWKAAVILEKSIDQEFVERNEKHMLLLTDAWMMAREYEKAIQTGSEAAEMAETGDSYYRLAQIHAQREEWKETFAAAENALKKSVDVNRGQVYLLKGMAAFQLRKIEEAKNVFMEAVKYDAGKQRASEWLSFIGQEKARIEYLRGT